MDHFAAGGPHADLTEADASALLDGMLAKLGPLRRALLVPPDATRADSWAGPLARLLWEKLHPQTYVEVLPALGTHDPMGAADLAAMYAGIPAERFRIHDWRNDLRTLGTVPASTLGELSGGRFAAPAEVAIARLIVEGGWDAIFSIGQLVPHEVAGIANHSKNILVGCGGKDFIDKSHFLSATAGIENVMGRPDNPVRRLFTKAAAFLAHLPIHYVLTVRAPRAAGGVATRGLFAGSGDECYFRGAELAVACNVTHLESAPRKIVARMAGGHYRTTWLANKAVYRTRRALADGGELIVLAPDVARFGEDHEIDRLIRKHGYRGAAATLAALAADPELAGNLSAAAHLIHSSSEGRFRITYCPGTLDRDAVLAAGFRYGSLAEQSIRYPHDRLAAGWNDLPDGERVYYIPNPALGLWTA